MRARKRASRPLAGGMYPAPRSPSNTRIKALPVRPWATSSMVTARSSSSPTIRAFRALSSARSVRSGWTQPARSKTVLATVVTGTAPRTVRWCSGRNRGWWVVARPDGRWVPRPVRLTWTASLRNPGRLHRRASAADDTTAEGPASSTAARHRCSKVGRHACQAQHVGTHPLPLARRHPPAEGAAIGAGGMRLRHPHQSVLTPGQLQHPSLYHSSLHHTIVLERV